MSLVGREVERLRPLLHPGRRVLVLTSDGGGPAEVARLLVADGFGGSGVTVLEALGGPEERVGRVTAGSSGSGFAGR